MGTSTHISKETPDDPFPNDAAVARLVTAVVVETHDEGEVVERRYLSETSLTILKRDAPAELSEPAADLLASGSIPEAMKTSLNDHVNTTRAVEADGGAPVPAGTHGFVLRVIEEPAEAYVVELYLSDWRATEETILFRLVHRL